MMIPPVPEYIQTLVPYQPGKPIEETKREYGLKKVIKLASNENPLGPSPRALEAIARHLKQLHRYPDGSGRDLKLALAAHAAHLGMKPSQFILGNGSNDIIELLIRTYCLPGDAIVTHKGAFIAYRISAQAHGVRTHEASVDAELNWSVEELINLVKQNERAKIVFLANPNNPTGSYFNRDQLERLVRGLASIRGGQTLLVLDYAYWEYTNVDDLVGPKEALEFSQNLVVLRTFSKIYGLAGLRVGYGMGPEPIISSLEKIRQPFNLNSLALVAAESALSDVAFVKKARMANLKGLEFWKRSLQKMEIPFWSSQGNFLLINTTAGLRKTAQEVFQEALKEGVIFRPITNYGFPNGLRITIGTSSENEEAIRVLTKLKKAWSKTGVKVKARA